MNDLIYWVWLSEKNHAGSCEVINLLESFENNPKAIFDATREELISANGGSSSFINRLSSHDLSRAELILESCFNSGVRIITCASPKYPKRLLSVYNRPILLYVRGEIEDLDNRFCVSIVGSRSMSDYGKHVTFTLARQLMAYGAIIISGAAYGIDSAANNTAVFFEEPTVAVLGSGINIPYPQRNKEMLDRIAANGMVISEYPPNTPPYGRNFPIRNRIISGLSDAVVIVEAGENSGALITANIACEQGRKVYAVPGNIGAPNSVGTNRIIRDGGKIVTCTNDIIEDFADEYNLAPISRIVNSDKYMRYEYNSMQSLSGNRPLDPDEQGRMKGIKLPKPPKKPKSEKATPASEEKASTLGGITFEPEILPDSPERERILKILGDTARRIYNAIPDRLSVTTDEITKAGIPADKVMAELTMLELYSVIEALPGGLYRKLM